MHDNAHTLHLVVMFYFWDVDVGDGCTGVVPDS
jgi:hypothetical protein